MAEFKKWNGGGEKVIIDPAQVKDVNEYTGVFMAGMTPPTGTKVTLNDGTKLHLEEQEEEVIKGLGFDKHGPFKKGVKAVLNYDESCELLIEKLRYVDGKRMAVCHVCGSENLKQDYDLTELKFKPV